MGHIPEEVLNAVHNFESDLHYQIVLKEAEGDLDEHLLKTNKSSIPKISNIIAIKKSGKNYYPIYIGRNSNIKESIFSKKVLKRLADLGKDYLFMLVVPFRKRYFLFGHSYSSFYCIGYISKSGKFKPTEDAYIETKVKNKADAISLLSPLEQKILEKLSKDPEIPIFRLASYLKIGRISLSAKVNSLQNKFKIKPIFEVNLANLGYFSFFGFVKFDLRMPPKEEIKSVFEKNLIINFAILSIDNFEIIFQAIGEDVEDILYSIYELRKTAFPEYDATWSIASAEIKYGYIPLRDGFFEIIEDNRIWDRSREYPRPGKLEISIIDCILLRDLNMNGKFDAKELSQRYNLDFQKIKYAYYKLMEKKEIIARQSLSICSPGFLYNVIAVIEPLNEEIPEIKELVEGYLEDNGSYPASKINLIIQTSIPSYIIVLSVYYQSDFDKFKDLANRLLKNSRISYILIDDIIVGSLSFQKQDNPKF
ncbi:MAG: hypothetical protein ACP5RP_00675 [Candidatus Micrarchaeia archaeon]